MCSLWSQKMHWDCLSVRQGKEIPWGAENNSCLKEIHCYSPSVDMLILNRAQKIAGLPHRDQVYISRFSSS